MMKNIENSIYQRVQELFATAAVDNMAGDMEAYKQKLETIAHVGEILGIETEITEVSINIKD